MVEGALNNMVLSMMSLPRPNPTKLDQRLYMTALANQDTFQRPGQFFGGDDESYGILSGNYSRGWGEHQQYRGVQDSSYGGPRSSHRSSARQMDSRNDPRYNSSNSSYDGSFRTQYNYLPP